MIAASRFSTLFAAAVFAVAAPCASYYEGTSLHTYVDPVGIPTACQGVTGPQIHMGQSFTPAQCDAMFAAKLSQEWNAVSKCIAADITIPQAAAILSWSYNVGAGAACGSTLLRMVNAGSPPQAWCAQLRRWTKARKLGVMIELPGLVKRREGEYRLCMSPAVAAFTDPIRVTGGAW